MGKRIKDRWCRIRGSFVSNRKTCQDKDRGLCIIPDLYKRLSYFIQLYFLTYSYVVWSLKTMFRSGFFMTKPYTSYQIHTTCFKCSFRICRKRLEIHLKFWGCAFLIENPCICRVSILLHFGFFVKQNLKIIKLFSTWSWSLIFFFTPYQPIFTTLSRPFPPHSLLNPGFESRW